MPTGLEGPNSLPSPGVQGSTSKDGYVSPVRRVSWLARRFPSLVFYSIFVFLIFACAWEAKRGRLTRKRRVEISMSMMNALEYVGVQLDVQHTSGFRQLDGPCVFVSNHMSSLETLAFSFIIEPYREITFVVKESLVKYPVFKYIMISRNPVVVTRVNPREDFETILREGQERLGRGISVVVFPQTTRSPQFDEKQFNTVGVKLARRAGVPIVPVALRTDAWGNSKWGVKDFGPIDPSKPVRIRFGDPIHLKGSGKEEHQQIVAFVRDHLTQWL